MHVLLVMVKSCIAPMKITTTSRLKLTAAVVSVKVAVMVQEDINYANLKQYFWTDFKEVLGCINNGTKRFHTFVANRVQVLRPNTDTIEWQYINTKNNPADHTSRGLIAEKLMKANWFSGTAFLWEKESHPVKKRFLTFKLETWKLRPLCARLQLRNPSVSLTAYHDFPAGQRQ